MNKNLKLILAGLGFGLLLLFAFVGVQSMLGKGERAEVEAISAQSASAPILGLPGEGGVASSANDVTKPEETETNNLELVGEAKTQEPTATQQAPEIPTETQIEAQASPPGQEPEQEPVIVSPENEPASETPLPALSTGKLEVTLQAAENGSPVDGNVYIQRTNGVNIEKSAYISVARFSLSPGNYRVTARTEGRGSVSRNITVAAGSVVSERFRLPLIAQTPKSVPPPPAPQPTPSARQTPPPNHGIARLRLVALSVEDGSPLEVNFTIARLDGQVLDSSRHVSFADFVLPAGEFIASFNYRGHQGYKSLSIQDGQKVSYTFNIPKGERERRRHHRPGGEQQPVQELPLPEQQPMPQPEQQSLDSVLMDRLQQQLMKNLTN